MNTRDFTSCLVLTLILGAGPGLARLNAAESQPSAREKEREYIAVLQSDAAPAQKAITCKRLVVVGTKDAVPALAPLLLNPELASWARIALEAIPDPSADEALRAAVPKLQGRQLVGVINSLGVRRDAQAIQLLAGKLSDGENEVAAAAAEALGHIGGKGAAQALRQALSEPREPVRSSIAYGCVLCAETLSAQGQASDAAQLYDQVRQADVPKQRKLEATRGAILARGPGGLPLLLEQLRSADAALFGIGVRVARELPGRDVTDALAKELDSASADRQLSLLLALADRTDSAVLPKVLQVAERGPQSIRATALGLLDRFRDLAAVPVLVNAATETDAEVARTAKATLTRLGSSEVDADILARLRLASGKTRQVLIDVAKQRRIAAALPLAVRSIEDSDAGVRRSAIEAVGTLGTDQQVGDLVRLLSSASKQEEREDIEGALVSICGRNGTKCLPAVLPLARSGETAYRVIGLHALASIGGPEALGVLKEALQDSDQNLQDEAVRTLSNWPNTWPDDSGVAEPLLQLAKSGRKVSHQVQGLQGYLQYLEENKKLSNEEKLAKLKDVLGFVKPEQKGQVITVIGTLPTGDALRTLVDLANDESVTEEACLATLKVASDRNLRGASRDEVRNALKMVTEKSKNDATRKRAEDRLRRMQQR